MRHSVVLVLCILAVSVSSTSWEWGDPTAPYNAWVTTGGIGLFQYTTVVEIPFKLKPDDKYHVQLTVANAISVPVATYDEKRQLITIQYSWIQNTVSIYSVTVKTAYPRNMRKVKKRPRPDGLTKLPSRQIFDFGLGR